MASVIDICNVALLRIGNGRTINSFNERSKEADVCEILFNYNLNVVLADFPWKFAQKRKALALLPDQVPGWAYCYQLPVDCLRVVSFVDKEHYPSVADGSLYEIGGGSQGRVILTNTEQAQIVYVATVTDPNSFDPLFIDALTWKLASEIALPLSASVDLANNASNQYIIALKKAESKSFEEQEEPVQRESELTRCRF